MKKYIILLLVSICAIGWRSEYIMQMIGLVSKVSAPKIYSIQSLTIPADQQKRAGITLTEYAELAKTDPDAYRKLFQSHQQEAERGEIDKLMNFLARGKYE